MVTVQRHMPAEIPNCNEQPGPWPPWLMMWSQSAYRSSFSISASPFVSRQHARHNPSAIMTRRAPQLAQESLWLIHGSVIQLLLPNNRKSRHLTPEPRCSASTRRSVHCVSVHVRAAGDWVPAARRGASAKSESCQSSTHFTIFVGMVDHADMPILRRPNP